MRHGLASLARAAAVSTAVASNAGAADFPLPEGAVLTAEDIRGDDTITVPVAPVGTAGEGLRAIEGFVVVRAWRQADMRETPLAILAPIRRSLEQQGYEPVFDCADEGCGGVDFRFAAPILPAPKMRVDVGDMAVATLSRPAAAGTMFASVLVSRVLGTAHLQVTLVEPGGSAPEPGQPAPVGALPAISAPAPAILEPAVTPSAEPDAPATLYATLMAEGRLELRLVDFESGGSALLPSGASELDAIAAMLTENPEIGVNVVGHSDTSGDFDTNVRLSKARAESVVAALVERGVAPDRLQAHAVGPLAPRATNRTAEGRAQNRRVVLVERRR